MSNEEKLMTYLLPSNTNHIKIFSEISANISDKALSDSTISDIKAWTLSKKEYETVNVNAINNIAITAIACIAILFFPKIAIVGSIAVVAFVYYELAKMIENKEKDLLLTIRNQRTVEFLSSPDLNKKSLKMLELFKTDGILEQMQTDLESLKELPLKVVLLEKYTKVIAKQKKINENLEQVDLIPLIEDSAKNNNTLKKIQEALEEETFFKEDLICANRKLLTFQKELNQKLKSLKENGSFFKENGALLNKVATFVLNTDLNIFNKARAYRDFIFYSLTSAVLIKANIFLLISLTKLTG